GRRVIVAADPCPTARRAATLARATSRNAIVSGFRRFLATSFRGILATWSLLTPRRHYSFSARRRDRTATTRRASRARSRRRARQAGSVAEVRVRTTKPDLRSPETRVGI